MSKQKSQAEKLYTVGEIAKKYKVPLSKVYEWRRRLYKKYRYRGVRIKGDSFRRRGFPSELVANFPEVDFPNYFEKV